MNESPIFIVGCPRSGTTLLRNLLRSHPRVTFPAESHFIPAFYRGYGDPHSDREAIDLARRILGLEWIRRWNLTLDPVAFARDRSFRQVISRLYEAWARQENKPRWGDKTPHYVTDIGALVELFPAGKVIHIVRDGRDVALSWLKTDFEPRNLFTAAHAWNRYVRAGRAAGAALPRDTYLEIKYESLLRQPVDTMRAVCAFIDEPFTDAVLRPRPLPGILRPALFGKRTLVIASQSELVSTNQAKWKTELAAADRVLFESVAGELLTALGYETEAVRRPISALEQVAWRVHDNFWWAMARLNTQGNHRWLMTDWQIRRARRRARRR